MGDNQHLQAGDCELQAQGDQAQLRGSDHWSGAVQASGGHLASNINSPGNIPKSKPETPKIYFPEVTVESVPEDSLESRDISTAGQESVIPGINDYHEVNIAILTAAAFVSSYDRITRGQEEPGLESDSTHGEEPLAALDGVDVTAHHLLGHGGHILQHEVHLLETHTEAEHRSDSGSVAVRMWDVVRNWQEEG